MDKYLDLARETQDMRNREMPVIPVVVGALGIIPKRLERKLEQFEIEGRI